jgi:hypothetical protein
MALSRPRAGFDSRMGNFLKNQKIYKSLFLIFSLHPESADHEINNLLAVFFKNQKGMREEILPLLREEIILGSHQPRA